MSRMRTSAKNKQVLAAFKAHRIDILIGTHRLLSADVDSKDLGLVIVDEEQRFGVKHKEKIKAMTTNIDVLTTGNPHPADLVYVINGAKAISTLATPPEGRMRIRTVISEYSLILKQPFKMNWLWGGQVYFA